MEETTRESDTPGRHDQLAEWLALKDRALDVAAEGVTIADARLPDRPLIYANEGFERMTGYAAADVMGRNCRFLQGPDTDAADVAEIRSALAEHRECVVEILNYRKDGTTFWNRLSIAPVRNDAGDVTHFIGVQSDVTARRLAEDGAAAVEGGHGAGSQAGGARAAGPAAARGVRGRCAPHRARLSPVRRSGWRRRGHRSPHAGPAGPLSPRRERPWRRRRAALVHADAPAVAGCRRGACSQRTPATDRSCVPPSRVAERLNRQFPMDRTRQYFTLVYGVIDPLTGRFDYVTAGHPSPIKLPGGGVPFAGGRRRPARSGCSTTRRTKTRRSTLEPGDRLYFYTDGVIEALDASRNGVRPPASPGGDRLPARSAAARRTRGGGGGCPGMVRGPPEGRRVAAGRRTDPLTFSPRERQLTRPGQPLPDVPQQAPQERRRLAHHREARLPCSARSTRGPAPERPGALP